MESAVDRYKGEHKKHRNVNKHRSGAGRIPACIAARRESFVSCSVEFEESATQCPEIYGTKWIITAKCHQKN